MPRRIYAAGVKDGSKKYSQIGDKVHVDVLLGEVAQQRAKNGPNFKAQEVLPIYKMRHSHDDIPNYDEAAVRYINAKKGKRSVPKEVINNYDTIPVKTSPFALRYPIDDRDVADQDDGFDLEADGAEILQENMLINLEVGAADLLFNADNYHADFTGDVASGHRFNDDTAPIIKDFTAKGEAIEAQTGYPVDMLKFAAGIDAFSALQNNAKVLERFKTTENKTNLTSAQLAEALGIRTVVRLGAIMTNTQYGETFNPTRIWTKDSAALYVGPETITRMSITKGAILHWDFKKVGNLYYFYVVDGDYEAHEVVCASDWGFKSFHLKAGHLFTKVNG